MSSFKVRLIASTDDDLKSYFIETIAKHKWRPGLEDINLYFAFDQPSAFVGLLDGKPIGTMAIHKYNDSFCMLSGFRVEEEFRGKGYGMQLYRTALKTLPPSCNIGASSIDYMVEKYKERSGFQEHWAVLTYDVQLPTASEILNRLPCTDLYCTKSIDQVDAQALFNYDTFVFGHHRHKFLETFLHARGSHVRVAINKEGVIVGYTAARVAFIKEEGYRLGPLYADSPEIAQVLLKALFEDVLERGMSSSTSVWLDIPVGINVEANKLMELLNGKVAFNMTFMTTNGIPKGRFNNWFAVSSVEFG